MNQKYKDSLYLTHLTRSVRAQYVTFFILLNGSWLNESYMLLVGLLRLWLQAQKNRSYSVLYFGCNEILRLNTKKSQVFLIGRYLLENAEFTYIIVECFPANNLDKNKIQFRRVSIK